MSTTFQPHPAIRPVVSTFGQRQAVAQVPAPRFGMDLSVAGGSLAQAVQTKQPEDNPRSGRWRRFFMLNAALTPLLTLALANVPTTSTFIREHINETHGKPLTTVLVQPEPAGLQIPRTEIIKRLQNTDYVPAALLYDAAKSGLIKEVLVSHTNAAEGRAVLLDGHEVTVELTSDVKSKLLTELGIPMRYPAFSGVQFTPLEASILALVLVNSMNSVLLSPRKRKKKSMQEEQKRRQVNDAIRFMVAQKLKVPDEPIYTEDIEKQLSQPDFLYGVKPLTVEELEKRTVSFSPGCWPSKSCMTTPH